MYQPLMERKEQLSGLVTESERFGITRYIEQYGKKLFALTEEKELEGAVAERMESLYRQGKLTKDSNRPIQCLMQDSPVFSCSGKWNHTMLGSFLKWPLRLVCVLRPLWINPNS